MMRLTRRKALLGGLLCVAALAVAPLASRRIEDEIRRILKRNFGERIATAPDAAPFVADVATLWNDLNSRQNRILRPSFWMLEPISSRAHSERSSLERNVIALFLRSTTAVRAHETGEDLQYLGIPDPYQSPCANPLSAAWL